MSFLAAALGSSGRRDSLRALHCPLLSRSGGRRPVAGTDARSGSPSARLRPTGRRTRTRPGHISRGPMIRTAEGQCWGCTCPPVRAQGGSGLPQGASVPATCSRPPLRESSGQCSDRRESRPTPEPSAAPRPGSPPVDLTADAPVSRHPDFERARPPRERRSACWLGREPWRPPLRGSWAEPS